MKNVKREVAGELAMVLTSPKAIFFIKMIVLGILLFWCGHAFADNADILQGTTGSAEATVKGSLLTYFYIAETIVAIVGYVVSRKPTVFLGIVILSLFVNVVFSVFIK